MKYSVSLLYLFLVFLFVSPAYSFSSSSAFVNSIEGQIFDENRVPLPDVNVELLNEVESLLSRTRTNSAGRFSFRGVSGGRFLVKVLPLARNLIGETKEVEVTPLRAGGSDRVYLDFYLRYDKRRSDMSPQRPAEAIFVQNIPQNAQKLYESGVDKLEKNQDTGLADLAEAINLFPTYFAALSRLGKEYFLRQNYEKAYPYLLRAIDVNSRNFSNYYTLALAFYQLKEMPAAIMAAKASITLDASSVNAQLLYGMLLRINGNYQDAEKALLKAKSLDNNTNSDIHWQLALLYQKLNRNEEAANELEAYLKIEKEAPNKKEIKDAIAKLRTPKQP